MRKRTMVLLGFLLLECCLVLLMAADRKPPVFVFRGKQVYVGMPEREATAALSDCCNSPPAEVEKQPAFGGMMPGHFILPKGWFPALR
jgi:hypothetical protein